MISVRRSACHGILLLGSSAGVTLVRFIGLTILARLLDPTDFGVANAAISILTIVSMVTSFGLGQALIQRTHIKNEEISAILIVLLVIGIIAATVIAGSAPWLAGYVFKEPAVASLLRVVSILFLVFPFQVVGDALLTRKQAFTTISLIAFISYAVGNLSVSVLAAYFGAGSLSIVLGVIGGYVLMSILYYMVNPFSIRFSSFPSTVIEYLRYGKGITLGRIANSIATQTDQLIIMRSLGAQALGLYGRASQLASIPAGLVGGTIAKLLFPMLAAQQHNPDKLNVIVLTAVGVNATLTIPVAMWLALESNHIIAIVLGNKWIETTMPFCILIGALLFRSGYKITQVVMQAMGFSCYYSRVELLYMVMVTTNTTVGTHWGLFGVSVGMFIAISMNYLIGAWLVIRITGIGAGAFVKIHRGGFILATVVGVVVIGLRFMVVGKNLSTLNQVALSATTAAIVVSLILRIIPNVLNKEVTVLLRRLSPKLTHIVVGPA